jgi:hypothetical protein
VRVLKQPVEVRALKLVQELELELEVPVPLEYLQERVLQLH